MSINYYIYYRSNEARDRVRKLVRDMQSALEQDTGVTGTLLHRSEDATTWMEVYEGVTDTAAFENRLAAAVERFGLRALLAPGDARHIERFSKA